MSLRIHVDAYSGHRANERPLRFWLDTDIDELIGIYEIEAVDDRWYEPSAEYFKVRTPDGKRFILRYNHEDNEWTLQSGLDGDELLRRPNGQVVAVDAPPQSAPRKNRLRPAETAVPMTRTGCSAAFSMM